MESGVYVIAMVALALAVCAIVQGRNSRRVLIKLLQDRPADARQILIEAGVSKETFR